MLKDPLVVTMLTASPEIRYSGVLDYMGTFNDPLDLLTLRSTDIGPGSSTRSGVMVDGTKVTMTVKHSQTAENKPAETVRTMVRFDFRRLNAISGKPVTLSTYAVIAHPWDDTFPVEDATLFAQSLALFILQGGLGGGVHPRNFDASAGQTTHRLLDGEA